MLKLFTRFGKTLVTLLLLPWLVLMVLGGYWLWQQGWLYQGIGILVANGVLAYGLLYWHRHSAKPLFRQPFQIMPNPNWSDKADQAWQELGLVTERWQYDVTLFTDPNQAIKLSNEVLMLVARQFHAESKYPILEFPMPYLLKLMVLVCEDIQHDLLDKIPGSHAVRVGDLLRALQAVESLNKYKSIFKMGQWLVNWSGATLTKAQTTLISMGLTTVTDEIAQRLVSAYISKLGYYAIQLYSGQITLDDIVPTDRLSAASKADIAALKDQQHSIEPLRFLVLGQVSSGKSSLINALFGELKSAEGLLPTTAEITPYLLEREGFQHALFLDSAGYGGTMSEAATKALKQEWAKIDVILMVCNVTQAAREVDVQQLNAIRLYFQEECLNRTLPLIIAVVTHIDQLRPLREWQPPYNILQPDRPKALAIRQACEAVAEALNLPLGSIVPVCLEPGRPAYNIEDSLIPLIHEQLGAAQRVRYLRCLREQQDESYWKQWRKQALQAGQIILKML